MQGVVLARRTILQMEAQLREIKTPTLIMVGDEDEPCIEPGLFMKRTIANSGLSVFPHCGHLLNLEEPELFNAMVLDFLVRVEKGAWPAH
jgi:pimeloyl-ACP methyl ester carboxylesterase